MMPRKRGKGWLGLAAAAMVLTWGQARAQSCPALTRPTYSLTTEIAPPVFRNDRSRADVSRLAGPTLPGHSQQGLTRTETEFSVTATIQGVQLEDGRLCFALQDAKAIWRITKLEVDIVREHRPGSCPHGVIRAHEEKHVALAQATFARHQSDIRARLGQLAQQSRPQVSRLSMAQATQLVRDRLLTGMQGALAAFERDLSRANAAIDTPESYRAETAKCPSWR